MPTQFFDGQIVISIYHIYSSTNLSFYQKQKLKSPSPPKKPQQTLFLPTRTFFYFEQVVNDFFISIVWHSIYKVSKFIRMIPVTCKYKQNLPLFIQICGMQVHPIQTFVH